MGQMGSRVVFCLVEERDTVEGVAAFRGILGGGWWPVHYLLQCLKLIRRMYRDF